jgi:hypothetical protein
MVAGLLLLLLLLHSLITRDDQQKDLDRAIMVLGSLAFLTALCDTPAHTRHAQVNPV